MTTWTLVILYWLGSSAAQTVVIQDIVSQQECARVSEEITKMSGPAAMRSRCIAIRKEK